MKGTMERVRWNYAGRAERCYTPRSCEDGCNVTETIPKVKRLSCGSYFRALEQRSSGDHDTMLQRKQSLFLLLAALLCFATWFFPVASYDRGSEHFDFRTYGLYAADGTELLDVGVKVPFSILLSVLGVGLLVTIFLYKDRKRQQRFVRSTYLLLLGISVFLFITDNSMRSYLEQGGSVISHLGLSFYFPIVALVLAFLAERSIKADEDLVRSVDRLR